VQILEGCCRVLRIPQIPDVEAWVHVIIIGDNELRGNDRVPHHLSLFGFDGFLPHRLIKEVIVGVLTSRAVIGLVELENRLGLPEIPDHNFAIFRSGGQDMRYDAVPANASDAMTFVEVWLSGFELSWLLHMADVLEEHFGAT
jgi:hypothetical protein